VSCRGLRAFACSWDEQLNRHLKRTMVHVTPDLLAGSPDIFAGKKAETREAPEFVRETDR